MRALRYDRYGPPEVLRIVEAAEPVPQAGEVKVRVHAASLNPLDWKIRAGHVRWLPVFRRPPRIPGCDFAGEIVGVGGGATGHYVGERVFGSLLPFGRAGTLAEFVVAGADRLATIPDEVSYEQAAALPIAAGTALQALVDEGRLAALAQEGTLRAHIERTIALEEVADARRAMETGHGRGKIVVRMALGGCAFGRERPPLHPPRRATRGTAPRSVRAASGCRDRRRSASTSAR
jgi:NADPH:quinone reductase-like Zn-dependent oxidoreductase